MSLTRLIFRVRASQRMFQEWISDAEIRYVLAAGKILENHPADRPYQIQLIAGSPGGRALQVVTAENQDTQETIVLTAYDSKTGF